MKIAGPYFDEPKRGQPRPWYLSYFIPKVDANGACVLNEAGQPVLRRMRHFYESKAKAQADVARIMEQYSVVGASSKVLDRSAASEYEKAKKIVGSASLIDVACFWRRHHPEKPKPKLEELVGLFLADLERRLGKERHWSDRKSRLAAFQATGFRDRYPDTISRSDVMEYLY